MDDDAERGVVFVLGITLGLTLMWLVFTARGRRTAQQVFEAAGDLAEDIADTTEDLLEDATQVAQSMTKPRKRFPFLT
jgi:hypothetical protein